MDNYNSPQEKRFQVSLGWDELRSGFSRGIPIRGFPSEAASRVNFL